jgi:homoserine kinase type II
MTISTESPHALELILARFGLASASIEPIASGRVNQHWRVGAGNQQYVLRRYQQSRSEQAIRSEHTALSHLHARDWPVATALACDGTSVVEIDGARYALFQLLPGRPRASASAAHYRMKGRLLARLHADLAACEMPQREGFGRLWELDITVAAQSPYATFNDLIFAFGQEQQGLARAMRAQKYAMLRELSTLGYGELPATLGHFDFQGDNLLFEDGELSGLLDLDFIRLDARVADIAFSIAFDCRAPPAYSEIEPGLVHAFVAGYAEHARLSDHEVQLIVPLARAAFVWNTTWWLAQWGAGARERALASVQRSLALHIPRFARRRPELEAAVLQGAVEGPNP